MSGVTCCQLVDRITGKKCYQGPLTKEQIERIAAAYNGSGPMAEKYGQDAMLVLQKAESGETPLYFYE